MKIRPNKLLIIMILIGCTALFALYFCVTQPLVTARPFSSPVISPYELETHVRMLSTTFYPRSFDREKNLNATADYIKTVLQQAGGQVSEQNYRVEESSYRNIMARYGPNNGPLLVIGAHYDSHADSSVEGNAAYTPGADDNASGVAGLLALAKLFQQTPPPIPVELVAYSTEEPPYFRTEHMGSAWHARLQRPVFLAISLEMIGYFQDTPQSQHYPLEMLKWFYPSTGNFISIVSRIDDWQATRQLKAAMSGASDLPVFSINAPPLLVGVDFSDHASYWQHNIPALMVTDTAFFRNRNYHTPNDTADKLDYQRMAKVVQGVYAFVMSK